MKINSNSYPLYLWHESQVYRGCILVAELFEGWYYPHYFDAFGDFALLADSPCGSLEAALEVARLVCDAHIDQAVKDGEYLFQNV